jgi:hypothetical protein
MHEEQSRQMLTQEAETVDHCPFIEGIFAAMQCDLDVPLSSPTERSGGRSSQLDQRPLGTPTTAEPRPVIAILAPRLAPFEVG